MSGEFLDLTGAYSARAPLVVPGLGIKTVEASVGAATYAPDLRQGMEHNITCTAATVTIGPPILGGGRIAGFTPLLITHVRNASGGPITVTWDAIFHQAAWVDPANGSGVVTLWHFDSTQGVWYSSARNTVVT